MNKGGREKKWVLNFLMFEDQHPKKISIVASIPIVASIQQLQTRTKNDQKKSLSILVDVLQMIEDIIPGTMNDL